MPPPSERLVQLMSQLTTGHNLSQTDQILSKSPEDVVSNDPMTL